jgi:hypothetical protein
MIKDNTVQARGRVVSFSVSKTVQEQQFEPVKLDIQYELAPDEDIEDAYDYVKEMALYLINK